VRRIKIGRGLMMYEEEQQRHTNLYFGNLRKKQSSCVTFNDSGKSPSIENGSSPPMYIPSPPAELRENSEGRSIQTGNMLLE